MNEQNRKVLADIIAGVETGGQRYGVYNYGAYAGPATNTQNEKTCTLGWAQNYGNEARKLCKMIFDKSPDVFRSADTAGIEGMLSVDWAGTRWAPDSHERAALIAIITTDIGKICQDELFDELADTYIARAEEFGIKDIKAQMMWCEVQHLGGKGAAERIFTRCAKNYTLDKILECLNPKYADFTKYKEPVESSKFYSRHVCCSTWAGKYAVDETEKEEKKEEKTEEKTMAYTADAVIAEAEKWEGYLEKASTGTDAQLQNKNWNPGSANITWFWRWHSRMGTLSGLQGGAWCDGFVDFVHGVVAGVEKASKSLNGFSGYTPDSANRYKSAGRWISRTGTPKRGDQIFFEGWVSSEGQYRIKHTGIVYKVTDTTVYTIEGNTSSAAGIVANGGCVRKKSYARDYSGIAGYGRPLYDAEAPEKKEEKKEEAAIPKGWCYKFRPRQVGSLGEKSTSVLLLQEILKARGLYKGPLNWTCGADLVSAINAYQTQRRKAGVELGENGKNDSLCGPKMWSDLLALPKDKDGYFYVYSVSKGVHSASALLLEEIFGSRGMYAGGLDWVCGDKLTASINVYQSERRVNGVELGFKGKNDGEAGGKVFKDLIAIA